MLKDEDWFFYVGFSSLNLNGKEMKIFLEAVTEKSEERVKNLGNFGGLRVYEKNSRHSIWLSNLDSVSVGIIDLTFFTFTLTAANHHPFPPPSQLFFLYSYHQNSSCVFVWKIHVAPLNSRRECNFILFYIGSEWSCRKTSTKRTIKK